jgi:hypothetical protein
MRALLIGATLVMLTVCLTNAPVALADDAANDPAGYHSGLDSYLRHWFDRVDAAEASQPHWLPPLVTTTPRLLEAVRYDQFFEHTGTGSSIDVYDANHFLELIPTTTNEILINPPAYQVVHGGKLPASGWGDWPFLLVKQRLFSANEQHGNYMLTALLGFQVPTGNTAFTNHAPVITPSISGGKGWGDFDVQATLGFPIPTAHDTTIGYSATFNVALQYHLLTYFWPELEANVTRFFSGQRGGKTQVFLTPNLMLGVFPIYGRLRAIVGAGYQFAVSPKLTQTPALTPMYNHAWIVSARLLF